MTPEQIGHLLYAGLIVIALALSILLAGRAHCAVAHRSVLLARSSGPGPA
jgi:hypothetical protein